MEIGRLKEFICLAKTLSYRTAARRCYVSQPTLSRHIASLESELSCKLFLRTASGAQLTPYGEILLKDAERILDTYETCLDEIRKIKSTNSTSLTVGYFYEASHTFLTEFYKEQHDSGAFTDCVINLKFLPMTEHKRRLDDDSVDIVIDMDLDYDDSTVYDKVPIYHDHSTIIVLPNHPLAKKSRITVDDLYGETLIVSSDFDKGVHTRFVLNALGPSSLKKINFSPVLSDPTEIPWYVHSKKGIGFAGGFVFDEIHDPGLTCIPIAEPNLEFNVSAIWKKSNETKAIRAFVSTLSAMAREERYRDFLPKSATDPV